MFCLLLNSFNTFSSVDYIHMNGYFKDDDEADDGASIRNPIRNDNLKM